MTLLDSQAASEDEFSWLAWFFNVSACLFGCMPVSLFVCLSFCLSACLSACLSVFLSGCLSVCLSVCLAVCLSVCLSVYLSVYLSACLSTYLSTAVCPWWMWMVLNRAVQNAVILDRLVSEETVYWKYLTVCQMKEGTRMAAFYCRSFHRSSFSRKTLRYAAGS